MKNHGMNPYLPSWEYVPDGEPHVFGKRVYIYGSHDRFAGYAFCQNDYVCWSAPVDDLTDWQYEGIIYTRAEAAHNEDGRQCLYPLNQFRNNFSVFNRIYNLESSLKVFRYLSIDDFLIIRNKGVKVIIHRFWFRKP